jgi:hypothetical protein
MTRKPIVGIIGGDDRRDEAMSAGGAVAACGAILLTGGGAPAESLKTDQVKDAAMAGYRKATGHSCGMVGILPSESVDWDFATSPGSLFLRTGMSSYERDAVNGLTPDVVIAFRGGEGTLCELAFAFFANARVLLADSLEHHRKKFREHKTKGPLQVALKAASNCYGRVGTIPVDAGQLLSLLERALDANSDDHLSTTPYSADALRKQLQTLPSELGQTGFPGLPLVVAESKARFEESIMNISSLLA